MDSLENQKIPKIPSFVISEPSENQPSITRGIGRKISQENETQQTFPIGGIGGGGGTTTTTTTGVAAPMDSEEFFLRRNSSSYCYSDDSLSNDSLSIGNQSPSSGSNTQSSHQHHYDDDRMQISHELENAGAEKFQIFQNFETTATFEVELSEVCSKLEASDILEMLRRTINDQVCCDCCVNV